MKTLEVGVDEVNSVLSFNEDIVGLRHPEVFAANYRSIKLAYYLKYSGALENRDKDHSEIIKLLKKHNFSVEKTEDPHYFRIEIKLSSNRKNVPHVTYLRPE